MGDVIDFRPRVGGWLLVLAYDSDSPEFARGFEAGMVYGQLKPRLESSLEVYVHASNAEMMNRIAEATGYVIDQLDSDGELLSLRFVRRAQED